MKKRNTLNYARETRGPNQEALFLLSPQQIPNFICVEQICPTSNPRGALVNVQFSATESPWMGRKRDLWLRGTRRCHCFSANIVHACRFAKDAFFYPSFQIFSVLIFLLHLRRFFPPLSFSPSSWCSQSCSRNGAPRSLRSKGNRPFYNVLDFCR